MTILSFLKALRNLGWVPRSQEGSKLALPSNSELVRWCNRGCILVDGEVITSMKDEIVFPVYSLVFFYKNDKKRCTMGGV